MYYEGDIEICGNVFPTLSLLPVIPQPTAIRNLSLQLDTTDMAKVTKFPLNTNTFKDIFNPISEVFSDIKCITYKHL